MHSRITLALAALLASTPSVAAENTSAAVYARDPAQPVDEAYTAKIREYTTDPSFNTPLTDYLPAAPGVPSPRFREDSFSRFSDLLPSDAIPSCGKLTMSERLGDDLVETREQPLAAIYVLRPVQPEAGARATRIAMPPIAATMALVQNAKLAKLLWGEESERLLHLVAEVSRRVPIWTLDVPRDLDLLPGVVERLLEWHAVPEPLPA